MAKTKKQQDRQFAKSIAKSTGQGRIKGKTTNQIMDTGSKRIRGQTLSIAKSAIKRAKVKVKTKNK